MLPVQGCRADSETALRQGAAALQAKGGLVMSLKSTALPITEPTAWDAALAELVGGQQDEREEQAGRSFGSMLPPKRCHVVEWQGAERVWPLSQKRKARGPGNAALSSGDADHGEAGTSTGEGAGAEGHAGAAGDLPGGHFADHGAYRRKAAPSAKVSSESDEDDTEADDTEADGGLEALPQELDKQLNPHQEDQQPPEAEDAVPGDAVATPEAGGPEGASSQVEEPAASVSTAPLRARQTSLQHSSASLCSLLPISDTFRPSQHEATATVQRTKRASRAGVESAAWPNHILSTRLLHLSVPVAQPPQV